MSEWEYQKIALNLLPRKTDDIDLLNDAGEEGWELVAILANNVAYLKREFDEPVSETIERSDGASVQEANAVGNGTVAIARNVHEVKAKYRDPKTNETWSGRGRMATWLKRKQDAGEDVDDYLV